MKWRRHITPALVGLLIYVVVRLINDSFARESHISHSSPSLILLEISIVIMSVYLLFYFWSGYDQSLEKQKLAPITVGIISRQLGVFLLIAMVILNLTVTPMTALTDDGMSLADFVLINVLGILFTTIWFFYSKTERYLEAYSRVKIHMEKVNTEKVETELRFLKNQIQPHFLFNALNTVYFQIDDSNEEAKRSVEQLSDLLRYGLYETENGKVSITKEMNYLKNYISLQQTRMGERVQVNYTDLITEDIPVYPHLISPLIENAFKHLPTRGGIIEIDIYTKGTELKVTVMNSFENSSECKNGESGIGLINLQKRLDLLYPNRHSLYIKKDQGNFIVKLNVDTIE